VTPHADELLAFWVPDERLAVLPKLLRNLLATRPQELTDDEHRQALAAVPSFE
jgi:hypothetical protein